jgi:hypothetical protein
VNATVNDAEPEVGSPLNDATGAAALTGTTVIHRHRRRTPTTIQTSLFDFILAPPIYLTSMKIRIFFIFNSYVIITYRFAPVLGNRYVYNWDSQGMISWYF